MWWNATFEPGLSLNILVKDFFQGHMISSLIEQIVTEKPWQGSYTFQVLIETLRFPEIGVRVTGSAMFFSFCGDVIDLTR